MILRSVRAVVVAFHAPEQLGCCLAGLEGRIPVLVVDNSASAEVAEVARRYSADYICCESNRGFAAGVNVALTHLRADRSDVLLLNPDALISSQAIEVLREFMDRRENAEVAAVAPRLFGSGRVEQRLVWPFPSPLRMWAEAIGLGRIPASRAFVVGAVLLLRRTAIDDVGLFDERFFLYAEEADWQRRAWERGWTSAVCMDAAAVHTGGGTSTSVRRRETLFHAAQETFIRKWFGAKGWGLYRGAAVLGSAVRAVVLMGERRREAARRTLLYLRGPRRCAKREPG